METILSVDTLALRSLVRFHAGLGWQNLNCNSVNFPRGGGKFIAYGYNSHQLQDEIARIFDGVIFDGVLNENDPEGKNRLSVEFDSRYVLIGNGGRVVGKTTMTGKKLMAFLRTRIIIPGPNPSPAVSLAPISEAIAECGKPKAPVDGCA